jgi:Rrf2 family protein
MHLSKKSEYALRAAINLGIAAQMGRGALPGSELAEVNRLPLKFVERILQELRDAGWVETYRGKFGGYSLTPQGLASKIGDIVRLMDGRLAPICCASEHAYQKCSCPDEVHCGLRMLMIDVRNAIANILDRYTLAEVVDVTVRKMHRAGVSPPFAPPRDEAPQGKRGRVKADPADGFLAGFLQHATATSSAEIITPHPDAPTYFI